MRDTTEFVASRLLSSYYYSSAPIDILEPSAGIGFLAMEITKKYPTSTLDCVELNKEKYNTLIQNGFHAIHGDFLLLDFPFKYDLIIAAPPFKGNIDLNHIRKMYDLLQSGGALFSLTSPYWLTNNEPIQIGFREWLSDKTHKLEILPDMSFSERGKTVHTAIIRIWKQ